MTVVRLQRHAPEAHQGSRCGVCGTTDATRLTDHVQVGTPGTPAYDDAICESCGAVLNTVARQYGDRLTMMIEEAQHDAGPQNVTVPGAKQHSHTTTTTTTDTDTDTGPRQT